MRQILEYFFWPHPPHTDFSNPKVVLVLLTCLGFVVLSFVLRFLRRRSHDAMFKKLSRTWPSAMLWFGIVGAVLLVSRVTEIQYVAMRIWWFVWAAALLFFIFVQYKQYRTRHYEILPRGPKVDPRDPYLPGRRK